MWSKNFRPSKNFILNKNKKIISKSEPSNFNRTAQNHWVHVVRLHVIQFYVISSQVYMIVITKCFEDYYNFFLLQNTKYYGGTKKSNVCIKFYHILHKIIQKSSYIHPHFRMMHLLFSAYSKVNSCTLCSFFHPKISLTVVAKNNEHKNWVCNIKNLPPLAMSTSRNVILATP
jgi:hypothetical protein